MEFLFKSKLKMLLTKDKEVQAQITSYDFVTNSLVAQVKDKRAYIALEDISIYQTKDTNEDVHKLLGSTINATVIKENKDDILLSRKAYMAKRIEKYQKGDEVTATIMSASDNALYLEFDEGLVGKMYTNQITSSKVDKPLDLYNIGDKIKCVIHKKQDDGRFLLSRLSLYKNVDLNVKYGNILKCKITQKLRENTGYFVEVLSNPLYSGIFDIDENNMYKCYNVGDTVNLRVVGVKQDKQIRFRTNIPKIEKKVL